MHDPFNFQISESADYHQYTVWSNGVVYNNISGKIIKFTKNKATEYHQACFRINGAPTTVYLHRLLAECFIPNPNNLSQVNHINGNKEDNRLENLEWVSPAENAIHFHEKLVKNGNYTPTSDIQKRYLLKYKSKKLLSKLQTNIDELNRCVCEYKNILRNIQEKYDLHI